MADEAHKVRNEDRRVTRTRGAIVDSFNQLVRERSYRSIQVPDILDEAGVGRSTFYEHFKNKDALLLQSASRFFEVLANAVNPDCDPSALTHVTSHFSQVRRMAKDLLASTAFDSIANDIASRIREKLRRRVASSTSSNVVLIDLGATQIAYAQLALVREWLHALEPRSSHRSCNRPR